MGILVFPCTNPPEWLPASLMTTLPWSCSQPCCCVLHPLVPCLLHAVSTGANLSQDRKQHVGFSKLPSSVTLQAVARFGVSSQGRTLVLFRRLARARDTLKVWGHTEAVGTH